MNIMPDGFGRAGGLGSVTCPFELCRARIEVVHEMRAPGPTAGPHVNRVPRHRFDSDLAWGAGEDCPASLMTLPLSNIASASLDEIAGMIRRAAERRAADEAAAARRRGEAPPNAMQQHSLTPKPTEDRPRWFRWGGPGPTDRRRS